MAPETLHRPWIQGHVPGAEPLQCILAFRYQRGRFSACLQGLAPDGKPFENFNGSLRKHRLGAKAVSPSTPHELPAEPQAQLESYPPKPIPGPERVSMEFAQLLGLRSGFRVEA